MHHHYAFIMAIWLLFFIGQFFHVLMRAYTSVTSALSGVKTYEEFFRLHAVPILVRVFLAVLCMMLWASNPDLFSLPLKRLAATVGYDFGVGASPLPLNPATAGLFGYLADSLLDKLTFLVPGLRKEIPPVNGQSQPATKV